LTDSVSIIPFPGQKLRERLPEVRATQQQSGNQIPYKPEEQKIPKTVLQPIGNLKIKGISIKEILNPIQTENAEATNQEVEVKESRPLELESLLMYWQRFAFHLKEQNKTSVFPMLTKRDPKIINDNTIIYYVDNEWVKEILKPELFDLLAYLKVNLKNGQLKIDIRVLEEDKQSVTPLSPNDKFKILVERNPNLQMLQRLFNLDLDY
jgi:hypothetical protein